MRRLSRPARCETIARMTIQRPSEPLEVALGGAFFFVLVFAGVFTLGFVLPVLWWISRGYPRLVDRDGIVTRGGASFGWETLEHTLVTRRGGMRLEFREGNVLVVPAMLANGGELLDYLQRCGVDTGVSVARASDDE